MVKQITKNAKPMPSIKKNTKLPSSTAASQDVTPLPECEASSSEILRLQALNDLAIDLASDLYFEKKLQQVADKVRLLVNADIALVVLLNEERDTHVIQTVSGTGTAHLTGVELSALRPPSPGAQTTDGNVWFFPKTAQQQTESRLFQDAIDNIEQAIAIPIQIKSRHLGFLFAGNQKIKPFTRSECCLLSLVSNLLATEIDRKRTDENQVRLETVLEQAAESIMITNHKGTIQYVNPAFERISGFTRNEAVGKTPRLVRSGKHNDAFYQNLTQTIQQGKIWHGHLINKHKTGTFYELKATISPIKDDTGQITHYVSVRKDVTEESALRKQLYQAQKMEALGTLAGGIAHDFNNLLMSIQGNISLMLFEMLEGNENYKRCKAIESYVKKGADLTRQLLGIARSGKYHSRVIDLNQLIQSNIDMFGRTKKEIQIVSNLSQKPCVVEVDQGQMDQVLLNLFVNAWQAMPNGGQLRVTSEIMNLKEYQARPTGLSAGNYVKIAVSDTGLGIDKMIIERIFDPFFTTKDKNLGTGLGLASVYGIVKNHGGMVTVKSPKGEGATFEIFLPYSCKKILPQQADQEGITKGKGTILLVDDEVAILDIGRQMLERLNYKVLTASNGQKAIDLYSLHHNDIDLIILDLIMPEMSGRDTYDRLADIDKRTPVLLASGYALADQSRAILKKGNSSFIQKPYNMTELSNAVSEILLNT